MAETDLGLADLRYAFWGGPSNERGLLQGWIDNNFTADDLVFKDPATGDLVDSSGASMDTSSSALAVIEKKVVPAGGDASIDFTSIPADYENLRLECSLRMASGGPTVIAVRFNGDATANYDDHRVNATDTTVSALVGDATNEIDFAVANGAAGVFSTIEAVIPGYARVDRNKSLVSRSFIVQALTTGSQYTQMFGGHWRTTDTAVNQVTLLHPGGVNFAEGSVATLYGLGTAPS